jgi:transcriptional regulator with XRE-family HTH domain
LAEGKKVLFSDALTQARERARLSKGDLARATGVSYKHIDNMEAGRRPPTLDTVRKLDKRLHFPAKVLLALIRGEPVQTTLHMLRRLGVILSVVLWS